MIPTRKKRTGARVRAVAVGSPGRLVTLEDPGARTEEEARGAFARLRPPEGVSPEKIEDWRARVAKVALAVKVLPALKPDDVPLASTRGDAGAGTASVREEATRLAAETGNSKVEALVSRLLDEVGA